MTIALSIFGICAVVWVIIVLDRVQKSYAKESEEDDNR